MGLAQLRSKARKQVEEAIKLIPLERKAAYLEAVDKAPHLIDTETDPLKFLRRCDYNIWDASERLCLYWKERKDIFGPQRAFLPLILTGDGALDKSDILSLQAGFPAMLPPSQTTGKQVLYFDRRQYLQDMTAANRHRSLFYLFQILAQDDRAQTDGVLAFILLVTPRFQDVDYNFAIRVLFFAIHAMPVKIQFHLLNVLPKGAKNRKLYAVQDLISSCAGHCLSSGATETEVHIERDEGELLQLLQAELGLTKAGIPTALGGTWTFVDASVWCRNQALAERKQYKWLQQEQKTTVLLPFAQHGSAQEQTVATTPPSTRTACAGVVVDDDDEQAQLNKKRAANVIYSRRKRERRRQELSLLMNEHNQLQQEQESLKSENVRLENLCAQARAAVEESSSLILSVPAEGDSCSSGAGGTKRTGQVSSGAGGTKRTGQEPCADRSMQTRSDVGLVVSSDHDHHAATKSRMMAAAQSDDDHASQFSGENPRQQEQAGLDKSSSQHAAAASTFDSENKMANFSRIAAEAVSCSAEERDALIRILLAQQQSQSQP